MLARSRCQIAKQRRSFTPEFKREAADLVLKQNCSYIEASRSLGIGGLSNCARSAIF
ncbi:transposase [Pseudomonas sp. SDO524_S393]